MLNELATRCVTDRHDLEILWSIHNYLSETIGNPGDIVVLGAPDLRIPAWIAACADELSANRSVILFDPFSKVRTAPKDCQNVDLSTLETNSQDGITNLTDFCQRNVIPEPIVVAGWFSDTLKKNFPPSVCFAHVDCGFFKEILEATWFIEESLSPGGCALIHGYGSGWVPCIQKAVDVALANRPEEAQIVLHNTVGKHALIRRKGGSGPEPDFLEKIDVEDEPDE